MNPWNNLQEFVVLSFWIFRELKKFRISWMNLSKSKKESLAEFLKYFMEDFRKESLTEFPKKSLQFSQEINGFFFSRNPWMGSKYMLPEISRGICRKISERIPKEFLMKCMEEFLISEAILQDFRKLTFENFLNKHPMKYPKKTSELFFDIFLFKKRNSTTLPKSVIQKWTQIWFS